MNEIETRERICAEALSWVGTPWHHEARVKHHGVDCAQFLIGVYSAVGLIESFETEHYPADWHLHNDSPRFLQIMLEHCRQVDEPKRGDVIMFRFGRQIAHGAIYLSPSLMVHAWQLDRAVVLAELARSPLEERVAGFYRWNGFI